MPSLDRMSDYADAISGFDRGHETVRDRLLANGLGCAGEGGEIADLVKKYVYHDHPRTIGELVPKLCLELGDYFWYGTRLADAVEIPVSAILQLNVNKLAHRHASGRFDPAYHTKPRCPQCGEAHLPEVRCEDTVFRPEKRLQEILAREPAAVGRFTSVGRVLQRNRPIMDWASNVGSRLSNVATLASNAHQEYADLRRLSMNSAADENRFRDAAKAFLEFTQETETKLRLQIDELDRAKRKMAEDLR